MGIKPPSHDPLAPMGRLRIALLDRLSKPLQEVNGEPDGQNREKQIAHAGHDGYPPARFMENPVRGPKPMDRYNEIAEQEWKERGSEQTYR